jgi:RES domain-containing protein
MPAAWRLTKTKYLSTAWDGSGAKRAGGRWNSVGVPVVYTSGALSLALVEVLVHLPSGVLPAYSAIQVEFDDALVTPVPDHQLPPGWRDNPAPPETRTIGDRWFAAGSSAVLRVRSVVVPPEFNYILNPAHPDFRRIAIGPVVPFPFDARLKQPAKA